MALAQVLLDAFMAGIRNGTILPESDAFKGSYQACDRMQQLKIANVLKAKGLSLPTAPFSPQIVASDLSQDVFAAPFANAGIPVEEFGRNWWFQYFWAEARSQAQTGTPIYVGESLNVTMARLASTVLVKQEVSPGSKEFKLALKASGAGGPSAAASSPGATAGDGIWKDTMIDLLKIGFRAKSQKDMVPAGHQQVQIDGQAQYQLIQERMFGKKFSEISGNAETSRVPVYWRSETRDLARIIQQGGTRRQCDVATLARDMNMDAAWHPFSDDEIRQYMWFRLGNKDNDYYTVISVATGFATACGFPKIDERRIYQFPATQVSEWTAADADRFRANLGLVVENGAPKVRLITATTTYMLVHNGSVLDTMGANTTLKSEAFPEIGVDYIPLENIFAVIPIWRVHHGPDPGHGFTVFVNKENAKRLHKGKEEALFGTNLFVRLASIYQSHLNQSPLATAWSKGGATAPGITAKITGIKEFPMLDASFQAFKASLGKGALSVAAPTLNTSRVSPQLTAGRK